MADDAFLGQDPGQEFGLADIEIALATEKDICSAESWSDYNSISREDGIIEVDEPVVDAEAQAEKDTGKRIRREVATDKITARVRALASQGLNFEQVRQELPDYSADTVRRAYNRQDVLGDQLPKRVGGIPRGEDRILKMFENDGVSIHNVILSLSGKVLRWNFVPKERYIRLGLEQRNPCQVWIHFFNLGDHDKEPWCKDPIRKDLQTFHFRAAPARKGFGDSVPFHPRLRGFDGSQILQEEITAIDAMATEIVRKHQQTP